MSMATPTCVLQGGGCQESALRVGMVSYRGDRSGELRWRLDNVGSRPPAEAKLTEDRNKAPRVIRLCQRSKQCVRGGKPSYRVVACLAGRGVGVRREDMRQMIFHTKGKVFTPKTLDRIVDCTALAGFRTRK